MDLSRTISEINGDFSGKSQNFPTPVYYASPLETGYRHTESRQLEWWRYRMVEKVVWYKRFSRLDGIPACDGQTDRRTPHDGKDRRHHFLTEMSKIKVIRAAWIMESTPIRRRLLLTTRSAADILINSEFLVVWLFTARRYAY